MRDPNQYSLDFDGRGRDLTSEEADAQVQKRLRLQSCLEWLWLRANKHHRHAAIMVPRTEDLRELARTLHEDSNHFAHIYAADLRQVLRERAIEEARDLDVKTSWKAA